MGSCCCVSDSADDAEATVPLPPRKTNITAQLPSPAYPSLSKPTVDLTPESPPGPVKRSLSTISVLRMNDTKEASRTATPAARPDAIKQHHTTSFSSSTPAAGPPAAQTHRNMLTSSPLRLSPTLRVVRENESSDNLDVAAFSDPEPISTKKSTPCATDEIHQIMPTAHRSESETAKQLLVAAAVPTPSSADVTPERATDPTAIPREEEGRTRGPSTAQVDEVPPTPKEESSKALPADDARVLQRAPPPPPPPASVSPVTPMEAGQDGEKHSVGEVHQAHQEATNSATRKDSVTVADEDEEGAEGQQESNPLAGIIRTWQENQKHHPTTLSIEATEDAPLEINRDKVNSPLAVATEAHAKGKPSRPSPLPPSESVNGVNLNDSDDDVKATPKTSMATTVATEQVDGPTSDPVYNNLPQHQWSALTKRGELHGILSNKRDSHTNLTTPEQKPNAAESSCADETQLTQQACSIMELSQMEPISWSKERLPEGTPLQGKNSHEADVSPSLYHPRRLGTDVPGRTECAAASEVTGKISTAAAFSDLFSGETKVEEQGVARGHGDDAEKPIIFTATSEIGRELEAVEVKSNNVEGTPTMDKDPVHTTGNTDVVDKLQSIVGNAVPSVALGASIGTTDQPIASPEKHATSALQAAENSASGDAEAPHCKPPLILCHGSDEARATPPPSRPAPPSIMSPSPA
ncbi:hypothetical protein, conserved [Leishmania lindenbergi]|uniref:Uncharacterized protein n=1 Tax=Leishmania lindenbergi TaxID=651832 RepID=A0AAW3AF28_9TRYP